MNKHTVGIILGFLGAGLICEAQANPVLEQAPIVLEYNLAGPATVEPEPIFGAGIIKTICVSYEFTGQVRLEASTNGGVDYIKIINGQPLVDGFIPGSQLRLRAIIGPASSLKKLVIGYTDSSGVSRLYRNPDLANYKNRREIYISGGSREVFNYPLRLNLDSRLRGNDARERGDDKSDRGLSPQGTVPEFYFTAADGQTPLYYYLERAASRHSEESRQRRGDEESRLLDSSPSAQNDSAIFYVKVPQIPKEGTRIYVYYKNKGDGSILKTDSLKKIEPSPLFNDGSKVFPFFEDFSGAALNEEKWEIIPGLKKEYGVKDGYLRIKDCLAVTRDFKTREGILEFKARAEDNAGIQAVIRTKVSAGLSPYEQIVYSSNYPGAEHTIAINNIAKVNVSKPIQPLTDYIYQATLNSTGILFERYSADRREKQAEIKFLDVGNFGAGYLGLKADAAPFNAGSVYFDWIRVRPYLEVEPEAIGGK